MARQKKLRPVDHYLKPAKATKGDGAAVAAMLMQIGKEGGAVTVKRLKVAAPPRTA